MKYLLSLILSLFFFPVVATAQQQIGGDIIGTKANYDIGLSLALSGDGTRVVVGSPGADRPEGHVRVYDLSGGDWVKLGEDLQGEGTRNTVGGSVAISADGNRLAYSVNEIEDQPGQVRILTWDGQEWVTEEILEGINANDEYFGEEIALSADGHTIIVGSPYRTTNEGANAGGVNVYRLTDSWTEITGDFVEGGFNENVGFAVAITDDGNRIAYTSRDGTFNSSRNSGYTLVYDYNGSSWSQVGSTIGGNGEFGDADGLGLTLSMTPDGNRMVVGGVGPSGQGYYRVVEFSGGDWVPVGEDHVGSSDGPRFDETILLNDTGDQLVLVTMRGGASDGIHIERLTDGNWTLGPPDLTDPQGDLGYAIALSGTILALSQPTASIDGVSLGAVRVYDISTLTSSRSYVQLPLAHVWPNPASDQLSISGVVFSTGQILDSYGRVIRTFSGRGGSISTANLPSGTYYLRLRSSAGWVTAQFVR